MSMAEGSGSGQPQQQNLFEIMMGIRRRVGAYQKLFDVNPKVDMGFVIKYLSKLFENENEVETNGRTLDKIKSVYEVYKEMREWDKEEAPIVLMQNVQDILRDDPFPLPSESNHSVGEKKQEVKQAQLTRQELGSCDQSINGNNSLPLVQASTYKYKCSYCPREFCHKKEWKTHKKFHMGRGNFFSCTYCQRPFAQLKSKEFHELSCFKSLNQNENVNEKGQKEVQPSSVSSSSSSSTSTSSSPSSSFSPSINRVESIFPPSTKVITTEGSALTQVLLNPNGNSNPNPTGENENEEMETGEIPNQNQNENVETGDESLDEMLSRVISTATQATLISTGASISLFGEGSVYRCHLCKDGQPHNSMEALANHIRRHIGERPFTCPHSGCKKSYSDSVSFKIHVKQPHLENGQVENRRKSQSKSRIKQSSASSSNRVCPYCDKYLSPNTSVARHILTHKGEMPFPCSECPARFAYSSARSYHMNKHHRQQQVQDSSLNINPDVRSIKSELASNENNNSVDLNGNDYTFMEKLKSLPEKRARQPNHTWAGTGYDTDTKDSDPDYKPSPKKRSRKQNFTGNGGGGASTSKIYKCIPCNKTYGNRGHFISHSRIHVKEEGKKHPLACRLCQLQFKDIERRTIHEVQDHSKNNQFYCQKCGAGFSTVAHLLAHHELVHSST